VHENCIPCYYHHFLGQVHGSTTRTAHHNSSNDLCHQDHVQRLLPTEGRVSVHYE